MKCWLNIISKSHSGKAVRNTHTNRVVHEFPGESEDMTMAIFVSSIKKKGKKRKRRNGNKTLNIVQCDIPEENNTLSCCLTRD